MSSTTKPIPSSILIVGSGVFGLGTAYALAQRDAFKNTKISVLDRLPFPAPDASSVDTSRIVRTDYADFAYSALAAHAQEHWRGEFGAEGRYTETGVVIAEDDDNAPGAGSMGHASLESVKKLGLSVGKKEDGAQITLLENEQDVRNVLPGFKGAAGHCGYVNWTCGWADAEAGLRYMRKKVESLGRVDFQTAESKGLLFKRDGNGQSVAGVELTSGEHITADLTILAAGAWSGKFIDLRGVASATGQTLAYINLEAGEQERIGRNPVVLNPSNFMYVIPPRDNVLKIARHGYGYANPQKIPHPERPDSGEEIVSSLPRTKQDDPDLNIAKEGLDELRAYLSRCLPELKDRQFAFTRICWYSDTPSGDWLIDYHPQYEGLFVATGGSGHGYKFLPVIGERIVDVLLDSPRDELGEALRRQWRWPSEKTQDFYWTDESRGGRRGMLLDEELART